MKQRTSPATTGKSSLLQTQDKSRGIFWEKPSSGKLLPLSRRQFLQFSGIVLAMPILGACRPLTDPALGTVSLPLGCEEAVLPVLRQETLTVKFARPTMGSTTRKHMVYADCSGTTNICGPTIRFKRGREGGQLRIKLVNELDSNELDPTIDKVLLDHLALDETVGHCPPHADPPRQFGLLATNLHTHGLHVAPEYSQSGDFADNVFLALLPKGADLPAHCHHSDMIFREGEAQLVFDIMPEHPPGTFWYHAHKHGSANLQVQQGLFGALIIEDEAHDPIPDYIRAATEHVIFYANATLLNDRGQDLREHPIKMRPGEVQRWRVINASPQANNHISLFFTNPHVEMHLIAFDGLMMSKRHLVTREDFTNPPLHKEIDKDWAALSPGNRADFLVRAGRTTPEGLVYMHTTTFEDAGQTISSDEENVIVKIVEGEEMEALWDDDPTLTPAHPDDLTAEEVEVAYHRTVTFNVGGGDDFRINEVHYDGTVLQPPMVKGTVEEWTVRVEDNTLTGSFLLHPFHIHVNPFFVTHHNGKELKPDDIRRRWQDTVAIPPTGSITFRTRFDNFAGKFVIHCHNLMHEDQGMMHKVKIVEPPDT